MNKNENYGKILGNGCYLTAVVWNSRLLIFFPQITKKTKPNNLTETNNIKELADKKSDQIQPITFWEIKLAWSEYRNRKWTPKQVSRDAIYKEPKDQNIDNPSLPIQYFKFVPVIRENNLVIEIKYKSPSDFDHTNPEDNFEFAFWFNGNNLISIPEMGLQEPQQIQFFNRYNIPGNTKLFSWQIPSIINDLPVREIYFESEGFGEKIIGLNPSEKFFHSFLPDLLGKVTQTDLSNLFGFKVTDPNIKVDTFGGYDEDKDTNTPQTYHELKRPYSIYNWELFFHAPMMLANSLSESGQFEEAMNWYHYVFNPMAEGDDDKRFWQFTPFKETDSKRILESIFNSLKPNQSNNSISEWRDNPFNPHLVARNRPVAYMKWVVMKYVDNLIAWGDHLFRQDTIETLNQATQLYVLAGHILGPKPQIIPKRGKTKPQTYNSLLEKWDAFGNAMVEMEVIAPNSNQISILVGDINGEPSFGNVFGFGSSLYFCIPNNPKLLGYWDTLADRLFKIRHCQNIDGIFRKLPLFEPPIDPALLVNATSQGVSISDVLNEIDTTMPNYRFYYLLQKALELCGELKSLGSLLLSAIEKKDNEKISLIRAKHENTTNNLILEIKKQQLEEANKTLESLQENRKAPELRMKYYLQLIGEDTGKVPGEDSDFNEIANSIDTPVSESGLKLSKYEKEDLSKASEAIKIQTASSITKVLAGLFVKIPDIAIAAMPLGTGVKTNVGGGEKLSQSLMLASEVLQIASSVASFQSAQAGKKGNFQRAMQERILQANAAGLEIKQIDKQIISQKIRIALAERELGNQQKMIDQSQEIEEFLKSKFTNVELYDWMRGSLKTLYRQIYGLTYDLAKKAEKAYQFERGLSSSNFIQGGFWNESYQGLLSGEKLFAGLKQLESAYQETRGHDYEITKHISLRQLNPLAILHIKEKGNCEFEIPEVIFDMDYPGHYKRRIKSVSISVPCVAGPYTSVNASLRLTNNKFRNSKIANNKEDYLEKLDETETRFSVSAVPITAIATSSAQNDSGMFELNFKDERYLPFEGAGVISSWHLDLPEFQQFDYQTISDVILHIHYTADNGGENLKDVANKARIDFVKKINDSIKESGLFAIIDLIHDLPTEWNRAFQTKDGNGNFSFNITELRKFLPYFVTTFDVNNAWIYCKNLSCKKADNQEQPTETFGEIELYDIQTFSSEGELLRFTETDKNNRKRAFLILKYSLKN